MPHCCCPRPDLCVAPATQPSAAPPPAPPSTPLIKKDIFKPQPRSPLHTVVDAFAADGAVSLAADAGAKNVHLPELLESMSVRPPTIGVKALRDCAQDRARRIGEWFRRSGGDRAVLWVVGVTGARALVRDLRKRSEEWWSRERKDRVMDGYVPNRELDALIVEGALVFGLTRMTTRLINGRPFFFSEFSIGANDLCIVDGRQIRNRAARYSVYPRGVHDLSEHY
jgi:hypothetical protein